MYGENLKSDIVQMSHHGQNGVSKEVLDLANEKIKIPMLGRTESLNASVATYVRVLKS